MTKEMLRDAETLSANEFAKKHINFGGPVTQALSQYVAYGPTAVKTTRPKMQKMPESMTADEEATLYAAAQQAGLEFFAAHPYIARGEYVAHNQAVFYNWLEQNGVLPTREAMEFALEEVATQLYYQLGERIIAPEEIESLPAEEFKTLTRAVPQARQVALENMSTAQLRGHIKELEAEDGVRGEATLEALVEQLPRNSEAWTQAKLELRELRAKRRNDVNKVPAIVIGQRDRLINSVLEQSPYLLNGLSREEVEDTLLTYLEKTQQSWSLQSLVAAANQLSEWGELPRSNERSIPGVRVVENPPFVASVPTRPIEVVDDKPKKYTQSQLREKIADMSAEELAKACRNDRAFERAVNEL